MELETALEERLKRNKTTNRLENKPTKRDVERSERRIIEDESIFRCNSYEGEITEKNYLKINNTNIFAEEAANMIKERFEL